MKYRNRRDKLIKNANERSIYADYKDDKEYYKLNKIKASFCAITHSMLMNDNFMQLSEKAKILYFYMTDYANGQKTFTFPKSVYGKIMCNETFKQKKNELIAYGFIEEKANGKNTRTENIYEFTGKWKNIKRPTKKKRITKLNHKD